jgi:hypothetical protein
VPILSSGFIAQKLVNLYIDSSQNTVGNSGSQWEGYRVQLQNTVTNETKTITVEQTGNYITFSDDILLNDNNDYQVKVGFTYSQEENAPPFTNYVAIPQYRPPSQVLNALVSLPEDWELARTTLNLTWNIPADNGSFPILGYQIQQSGTLDSSYSLVRSSGSLNTNTFINVSGLTANKTYVYDIRSFNIKGLSNAVFVSGVTSSIVKLSGILSTDSTIITTDQKLYDSSVFNASGSFTYVDSISTFNYAYHIIGLAYVSEVKNDIYGLHYDLLGSDSLVIKSDQSDQSYTYESLESAYSWF